MKRSPKNKVVHEEHVTITHVLADGTKVDSIEGHVIPAGHQFYDVMLAIAEKIVIKREDLSA